ncbi:MAG: 4-hydroxy-tetrahydrodipicolinate synthase [Flavobacteriaceae bacterium]|nr:4-hydroxy-tetrahydrodipicolinate synthase [Flavobacteriaceae bacterium]
MKKFYGTGVALVTPFLEDGSIDCASLEALVHHCVNDGVEYLVVLGTTAETATLSKQEKQLVAKTVVAANAKRVPLVVGIGGNHTQAVVDALQQLDLQGFDAILSVSPYYNRPTQEGIYQHFVKVATHSPLPIIIYNVPSRTASNIEAATVARLAKDCDQIIGIKEAKGDMVQTYDLIRHTPKDFLVISGDDITALASTLAGGAGVISVLGQALVSDFSEMIRLGLRREVDAAYSLQYKLMSVIDLIFEEGNPAGIKNLLEQLQIIKSSKVRLPLIAASPVLQDKIKSYLKANTLLNIA